MSRTFEDKHGVRWTLALNVAFAGHVKGQLGIDLLEADPETPFTQRMIDDPSLMLGYLEVLLVGQAKGHGIKCSKPGWLMRRLNAVAMKAAVAAAFEDIVDFFQKSGRGASPPSPETIARLSEACVAALPADGLPSTSSPDTSASTPPP
jgi:hypothetical protein